MSALEEALPDYLTADQVRMVERAYTVAAYWHRDQTRRNGEPYITHPVAVAAILADLGADHELLCAALLHDVLEDTACPETELAAEFGETIVRLVTDLQQLDDPALLAEGWEATTDDRVLTLRLADRLHNQRTMRFLPPEKQLRKSRETLDVFVPIAGRLGMNEIARELEGLAQARLDVSGDAGMQAVLQVITAGATILPHDVRARWIAEWLGELYALPDQRARRRFTAELLVGMPRLAAMLRRPEFNLRQLRNRLLCVLGWILASNFRTWALLSPLLVWMVLETAESNVGDALAILITVPPVLGAAVTALRTKLRNANETRRL